MSKEELYDLFDAPVTERVQIKVTPEPIIERTIGNVAASLYELDFSVNHSEPITEKEPIVEIPPHLAIAAVAAVVQIEQPKVEEAVSAPIEFPESIVQRFNEALSLLTQGDDRVAFSLLDIERLSGGPLGKEDRWYLKEYGKQSDQVYYLGDGLFGITKRLVENPDWQGQSEQDSTVGLNWLAEEVLARVQQNSDGEIVYRHEIRAIVRELGYNLFQKEDRAFFSMLSERNGVTIEAGKPEPQVDIKALVEDTVAIMASSRIYKQEFGISNILGIIKSQGITLYTDEMNELMVTLAAHPGVTPRENGTFRVAHISTTESSEGQVTRPKVFKVKRPQDVSRALREINKTDEMKRARDLAKNYADARRLHKTHSKKRRGKRLQGRAHGQKPTFQQVLTQSLTNAPKVEPIKRAENGSTES